MVCQWLFDKSHPTEEVLGRLEDAGAVVFRTDWHGHVVARSDGTEVSFSVERNATGTVAETAAGKQSAGGEARTSVPAPAAYILNTSSKKFHLPTCSAAKRIKDANRKDADYSRQHLLDQDYEPCGLCRP